MANVPSLEQKGRMILDIYAHYESRPGHVLRANNFVAVGARRRWNMTHLQDGLEFAVTQGWVSNVDSGGFELTQSGFKSMQ